MRRPAGSAPRRLSCGAYKVALRRGAMSAWLLLGLLLMPPPVAAWTVQLSENALPGLRVASNNEAVTWATGALNLALAADEGVRVTDNRLRVLTTPVHSSAEFSVPCERHPDALCQVKGDDLAESLGIGDGSLIFPVNGTVNLDPEFQFRGCTRGTGRVLVTSGRYDVSACDVFDSNLDVLLHDGRLSVFRVELNSTLYGWVGFVVIIAIVIITQNLAADLFHDASGTVHPVDAKWCVLLGAAIVALAGIAPGAEIDQANACEGWHFTLCGLFYPLLSLTDQFFMFIALLYILVQVLCGVAPEAVLWMQGWWHGAAPTGNKRPLHSVNFLVACILISVVSTHGSVETPLTAPLTFVLLFRVIFKVLSLKLKSNTAELEVSARVAEPLLVAADCVLIVNCTLLGVLPNATHPVEGITFCAMLFIVAAVLAHEALQRQHAV